jgi:uncharacterized membrane protein
MKDNFFFQVTEYSRVLVNLDQACNIAICLATMTILGTIFLRILLVLGISVSLLSVVWSCLLSAAS